MMRAKMTYWSLLSAAMLLAGCGGGGGGSPSDAGSPEGIYDGSVSNGLEHSTLVLEDNRYYSIVGEETDGEFFVVGLIQGSGTANNGSFTSTDLRSYYYDGSTFTGSLSASYRAGETISGSITEDTSTVTFTGATPEGDQSVYNTPASLANITGTWAMSTMQGEDLTMSIQPDGVFTATSTGGCTFDGTIAPRASGKNVFDVDLTFGAAPCAFPGESANGVATEISNEGMQQLLIAGTTDDREGGTVIFGIR